IIEFEPDKQNKSTQEDLNSLISDTDSSIIESFRLSEEKNKLHGTDIKEIIKPENKIEKKKNSTEIKTNSDNALLAVSKDSFTINLATFTELDRAREFVLNNNIADKAFIYEFGKDKKYTKVLYGVYKSYSDAQEEIKTLSKELSKNKPSIDGINKHQELYLKYN
ncbi:SPOR domain-containing protein, partial [Arcobacter sp.]|uniref:SPOR domain-containing protein n=1 Tax=Arcobacter sp. TaxID=1872629 RepID=UPI003C761EE5